MEKRDYFDVTIKTNGINEKGEPETLQEKFLQRNENELRALHEQFLRAAGTDGVKVKHTSTNKTCITNQYGDTFEFEKFDNDL